MRVALILTGYIDRVEESFPHYLRQIKESTRATVVDIFASVHSDTGQGIDDLSMFREHFTDSKTFVESQSQKQLPWLLHRGHPSIAEFAEAVNYWRPQLEKYDIVWRSRWDNYLVGDGNTLDAQLRNCLNSGQSQTDTASIGQKTHSVVTCNIFLKHGKPAMEGKHHWVTSHTAIEVFDNWEAKWTAWMDCMYGHTVDSHLTWANIYTSIKSNVTLGKYSVEKVIETPQFDINLINGQQGQRHVVSDLQNQRRAQLERKIKG